jgi:hypothetical protein
MPAPSLWIDPIDLFVRRTTKYTFDLYNEDGSQLVIAADDNVRAKVWATDDATPDIEADIGSTNSEVEVVTLGVPSTTPAQVTVTFHQTDTADLDPAVSYRFELFLVDHSDSDRAKVLCRAEVVVNGSAAGDMGV